ncbi:hypothetical protein BGY98DRAFT_1096820 [Russula aff. rugulosa BPL654]|nr:hypothetical protein BGY98DRAFT_1096820 [Russula aff. rugulosa BPL654]
MSSPLQVEHILSPASQDTIMASTPPPTFSGPDQAAVKGGAKPNQSSVGNVDLSVFNILNIFSQKDEDGNIF